MGLSNGSLLVAFRGKAPVGVPGDFVPQKPKLFCV